MMRVLLIEDDAELGNLVRRNLVRAGFVIDLMANVECARAAMATTGYDLALVDLGLPDGDGVELIRECRRSGMTAPIIALTARDSVADRVRGLNAGADDYVVKPYALEELIARMRAQLRRPNGALGARLEAGNITFDTKTGAVSVDDRPLLLTRRELTLLEILLRRAGNVVTRRAIEDGLYGFDDCVEDNALDATVSRLRRRLHMAGSAARIHTVRGVGYMLTTAAA